MLSDYAKMISATVEGIREYWLRQALIQCDHAKGHPVGILLAFDREPEIVTWEYAADVFTGVAVRVDEFAARIKLLMNEGGDVT